MPDTHISPEMASAVGTELGRVVSFPVSASDIRRWAIAVYWPEPPPARFLDEVVASKTPQGGLVAPEDFNPFAWAVAESGERPEADDIDPDRTEILAGIQGPGLKNQLNGGMEAEYGALMRPGDVITSVNRIAEYREREGRLGLMLFTISEDTWTNSDDEMVKKTRQTLIRY